MEDKQSHIRHAPLWPLGWLAAVAVMCTLGAYHWLIYIPDPAHPHKLAVLERLFAAGVAIGILFTGLLLGLRGLTLLRLLNRFGRTETAALATGLGLGILSLIVLLVGAFHLYYPVTFALLLLLLPWLCSAERMWTWELLRCAWVRGKRLLQVRLWRRVSLVNSVTALLLGALSASVAFLTFVRDLTLPTTAYDSYQYHWAIPNLLLLSHGMLAFPGWAHANLPYNTEMLDLVALGLQTPEAATLVQDSFELLLALLIFSLIRHTFGSLAAWLAVASVITVPLLIMYASLSYVETALIYYGMAALVVVLRWIEQMAHAGRDAGYRLLLLSGLFLGLGLGVKYTAFEYVAGVGLLVLVGAPLVALRVSPRERLRPILTHSLRSYAVCFGAMLLALAPWLIKTWVLLGNPVYPALASIFGAPLWNSARDQTLTATFSSFGPHAGLAYRLHLFAIDLFLHPAPYGEGWSVTPGVWAAGVVLLLPFFALLLLRARGMPTQGQTRVVLAFAVVTLLSFAVWTFSGALVERYALPAILFATTLGATLLGWLASLLRRRVILVPWLLLLAVFLVCGSYERTYLSTNAKAQAVIPMLAGHISEDQYQRTHLIGISADFWQAVGYMNQRLPRDGRLLMLGRGTGYFFTNRDYVADSGGDWIPYLVSAGKTPAGILGILRAQDFTYVIYDEVVIDFLVGPYHNHVLTSYLPAWLTVQRCDLIPVDRWGSVSLYRVPPTGTPPAACAAPSG